jgi:orotate phosphoribosyltransferase-like protein
MLYTEIKRKIREIKELTKLGLISTNWIRDLEVFEQFQVYISDGNNKQDSYAFTAEDFKISWQSVRLIVSKMLKD